MTLRLWLLIAAIFCALVLVAIDLSWVDVDGDQHIPAWLGLSMLFGWSSQAVNR